MFKLTPEAAKQVRIAAEQGQCEHLSLRLAANKNPDGSLEYGMGFDEANDDDLILRCEGLEVIMAPQYEPLFEGAVMDYAELEPGQYHFIFLNPNDANYTPPADDGGAGGCGSGGCSSCH